MERSNGLPEVVTHSDLEVAPNAAEAAYKDSYAANYQQPYYQDQGVLYSTLPQVTTPNGGPKGTGRRILGLRATTFWLVLVLVVVIIAAAIGGGVGGSQAVANARE